MITPWMLEMAPLPPPTEPPSGFVVLIALSTIAIAGIVVIARTLSSKQT
jgi:hypothetical protein